MYGIRRYAAGFDIFIKLIIVSKIAIHKNMISMNARSGLSKPKNNTDQSVFKINWIANRDIANFLLLRV
jgi:hypothetical protein